MCKIFLSLAIFIVPSLLYCMKSGEEKPTGNTPPGPKKYNLKMSLPKISVQGATPTSSALPSPRDSKPPTRSSLPHLPSISEQLPTQSPRTKSSRETNDPYAQGDKALYRALMSNDITDLKTFLDLAERTKPYFDWWQDFTKDEYIVKDALTADGAGNTYFLIETIIQQDTQHPIDNSYHARTEMIFDEISDQAKRDLNWQNYAARYNNNEIQSFISQQTMKRDSSSFGSDSSDSPSPRPSLTSSLADSASTVPLQEGDGLDDNDGTDETDSSHEIADVVEENAHHIQNGTPPRKNSIIPRIKRRDLICWACGVASCLVAQALVRLWYNSDKDLDEELIPDDPAILAISSSEPTTH